MEATVPDNTALFADEHSVLEALVFVRNAPIAIEEKAMLRDMFLDYVSSEGEDNQKLRQEIVKKLRSTTGVPKELLRLISNDTNVTRTPSGSETGVATNRRLGHSRPSLSFSPKMTNEVAQEVPEIAKVVEPVSSLEEKEEPSPDVISTPAYGISPSALESQRQTPQNEVDKTESAPAVEITSVPAASMGVDPKTRINTIKHDINTAVGNPVNLINMDAAIGREYMSSLLEAMKSVSAGSVATAELARLEAAYAEAKQLIEKSGGAPMAEKVEPAAQTRPDPEPIPTPLTPTPPVPPPPVEPQPQSQLKPVSVSVPENEKDEIGGGFADAAPHQTTQESTNQSGLYHRPEDEVISNTPVPPTKDEVLPTNSTSRTLPDNNEGKRSALSNLAVGLWSKKESPTSAKDDEQNKEKPDGAPLTTPIERSPVRKVGVVDGTEDSSVNPAPTAPDTNKAAEEKAFSGSDAESHLKPISTATSLPEKMSEVKKAAGEAEAVKHQPVTDLNASEVTIGLEQLLSEWKLFKKSGMFGTGPNGINHPLYKKLADQPMAIVVAGRFEGATPDIKRSLTAYMNGWRYEQGIIHEMGETFETYIRRVILHILQKNRK